MASKLSEKVHQYLLAKEAAESAAKVAKEIEKEIKTIMSMNDITWFEQDGKMLILISAERRSFDAKMLKNLVSSSVFLTVTTTQVRSEMLDAAVAVGMISEEVAKKITTKVQYSHLRIGKSHHGTH